MSNSCRTLNGGEITVEEAEASDGFEVLELPQDLVENHLTKTFTPGRYAKVCRDIAYFTSKIGKAPKKGMGKDYGSPGSGMRRSKEGALYNLAHRVPLLKRAAELDFIEPTNEEGFDAPSGELRFTITARGKWFLKLYYGEHIPVRKVKRVKLSRYSSATNVSKIVVSADSADSIKPVEEWDEQVGGGPITGDVNVGTYHTQADMVSAPAEDPHGEPLRRWIDEKESPDQFNVAQLDRDVHIHCDLEQLAGDVSNFGYTPQPVIFELSADNDIQITEGERCDVSIAEDTGTKVAIRGGYEAFVETGAKDAFKRATDAQWSDDYKQWYIPSEETLIGIEAILTESEVDAVSAPARIIHKYTKYL